MTAFDSTFVTLFRVSTQQQSEKYGLDWQRDNLPPYGDQHLGTCIGIYDEGATSTSLAIEKRADLQELLADLETLRPGFLLLADQDRISRGNDLWLIKAELARFGVKLAFYREGGSPEILDLEDEYGDFSSDVLGAVAKLEKRRIAKRMKRGKQQAARSGKAVQPVTYGYYKPSKGEVAVVPEKAEIVIVIYTRIADGASIRKTVQWLNQSGIPSPRGRIGGWTLSYVAKMVKNTSYIGRAKMLGVEVPFPRIVSDELFLRVQETVHENSSRSTRNNTRFDYLVRSLITCARCGRAICGHPKHDKPYYRCSGHGHDLAKGLPPGERCSQPEVSAAEIDVAVWQALRPLILNPAMISAYATSPSTVVAAEATFLRRKIGRYDERRRKVLDQHQRTWITDEEAEAELQEIAAERAKDETLLGTFEVQETVEHVDLTRLVEAESLCRKLAPRLERLSFADKRALVEKLVRGVKLDGRNVTVEVIVPLVAADEEFARQTG